MSSRIQRSNCNADQNAKGGTMIVWCGFANLVLAVVLIPTFHVEKGIGTRHSCSYLHSGAN